MQLDDLDQRILAHLQEDGRVSYVALAAELDVSEGTIRKRVRKLESNDIVKTVGITNPLKVGLDTVAFIWFEIDRHHLQNVIERLKSIEAVRYLLVATGSHDLVAMVALPSRDQLVRLLNEDLSSIEGIISTETSIVLQIHKQMYEWTPFAHLKTGSKQEMNTNG